MKKNFFAFFIFLIFCDSGFAETFYFKNCKLSENVTGSYIIDLDKNLINVTLKTSSGREQKFVDKIKLITKDRVVSEIIKKENTEFSTQYFLDVKSESVIRQLYKREADIDLIRPEGPKKHGFCSKVKANWYKSDKEKKLEKEKEKIKNLEKSLELNESFPKCKEDDLRQWTNCLGLFISEDGYIYLGIWLDGKQHGKGVEVWEDGRKYIGEFKNDKKDGNGTFSLSDGTKYIGQYKNGKQHGHGVYLGSNGDKYSGTFKDGVREGQGTLTLNSGNVFKGKFVKGKITEGTLIYKDGEKYVGEFEFNKPHGKGNLTYSNGAKFIGQFLDGFEDGEGTCVSPNGSKITCTMSSLENYLGKNKFSISIISSWHKIEEQINLRENLIIKFDKKSSESCILTGNGNFTVITQKIEIKEIDETPAFGLEPKYKLGIEGVVQCN